ncbi:unnamed protein product, partial [Ectocarpus fasciculatus]
SGGSSGSDGVGAGALPSFSFGAACRPTSRPPSSVWGSGRISSSGTVRTSFNFPATSGASGAPAGAGAGPKMPAASSPELPAGTGDEASATAASTTSATSAAAAAAAAATATAVTAGHVRGGSSGGDGDWDGAAASTSSLSTASAATASVASNAPAAGHVGVGIGSCGDGVDAFPTFSFGTIASGPPARAWDIWSFGNFAIAAGSSPVTRGVFGAPAPAGAGPKMLTPSLPGTGDGAAGTSSAADSAGKVIRGCDDAVVGELGAPAPRHSSTPPAPADGTPVEVEQGMDPTAGTSLPRQAPQQEPV